MQDPQPPAVPPFTPHEDPDSCSEGMPSPEQLEEEIAELAVHIDAATWRLLRAIREFEKLEAWGHGFASCAHWLSWRTGMDLITAREKVRVARALDDLPQISHALREGRISYSKVRAMVRIATPENEAELLHIAREGTTSHMERLVRAYRRAKQGEDLEEVRDRHERRYLDIYTDDDGMMVIRGRVPPEVRALLQKALDAAVLALREERREATDGDNQVPARESGVQRSASREGLVPTLDDSPESLASSKHTAQAHGSFGPEKTTSSTDVHDSPESPSSTASQCGLDSAESSPMHAPSPAASHHRTSQPRETYDQLCADALGLLAEAALGQGLGQTERGEPYQVVIHVDAQVFEDPYQQGQCETDKGDGISAETCRRIACDAPTVTVTGTPHDESIHMGRKTRKISTPLWRTLADRDRVCRFPGCNRTGKLQAHHIQHWAQGGTTDPDNLVLLCRAHHWAVHERGYKVHGRNTEGLTFRTPEGRVLPTSPPPEALQADPVASLKASHRGLGLHITAETSACNWDGGPMDYDISVMGVMGTEEAGLA